MAEAIECIDEEALFNFDCFCFSLILFRSLFLPLAMMLMTTKCPVSVLTRATSRS